MSKPIRYKRSNKKSEMDGGMATFLTFMVLFGIPIIGSICESMI